MPRGVHEQVLARLEPLFPIRALDSFFRPSVHRSEVIVYLCNFVESRFVFSALCSVATFPRIAVQRVVDILAKALVPQTYPFFCHCRHRFSQKCRRGLPELFWNEQSVLMDIANQSIRNHPLFRCLFALASYSYFLSVIEVWSGYEFEQP
jgi:hypothetical protein